MGDVHIVYTYEITHPHPHPHTLLRWPPTSKPLFLSGTSPLHLFILPPESPEQQPQPSPQHLSRFTLNLKDESLTCFSKSSAYPQTSPIIKNKNKCYLKKWNKWSNRTQVSLSVAVIQQQCREKLRGYSEPPDTFAHVFQTVTLAFKLSRIGALFIFATCCIPIGKKVILTGARSEAGFLKSRSQPPMSEASHSVAPRGKGKSL